MNRQRWNQRYAAVPLLWDVDPGPFLSGEVGTMTPGRALDLGAGEGRNTVWLATKGWNVTAVDFSDVALDRGRQRAEAAGVAGRIAWVDADLTRYDPAADGAAYDLVLVLFLHLLARQRRRLLRRAANALAPRGTILVVGYCQGPPDAARLYTPADIVADLEGLTIERAEELAIGDAVDTIVRATR